MTSRPPRADLPALPALAALLLALLLPPSAPAQPQAEGVLAEDASPAADTAAACNYFGQSGRCSYPRDAG